MLLDLLATRPFARYLPAALLRPLTTDAVERRHRHMARANVSELIPSPPHTPYEGLFFL